MHSQWLAALAGSLTHLLVFTQMSYRKNNTQAYRKKLERNIQKDSLRHSLEMVDLFLSYIFIFSMLPTMITHYFYNFKRSVYWK
jgi:hypothetical protein